MVASVIKTLVTKSLTRRFSHLNPDQYNGACLLGLRGTVIKSHGAANQRAFEVAIEQAVQAVQRQVPQRIAARPNLYTQLDSNCWTVAKAQPHEHTDNGAFVNVANVSAICSWRYITKK